MKVLMNLTELKTRLNCKPSWMDHKQSSFSLPNDKATRYAFIQKVLKQFHYRALTKSQKGIVIQLLLRVSDYSRQQLTRLTHQYQSRGAVVLTSRTVSQGFKRRYTEEDIQLLATMDERYETPGGTVIKKLCERACQLFSQDEYQR